MRLKLPPTQRSSQMPPEAPRFLILLFAVIILVIGLVVLKQSSPKPGDNPTDGQVAVVKDTVSPKDTAVPVDVSLAPGELALDDFTIIVPETWQRRQEMEDEGQGTKLFLVGPELAKVNLVLGVDVYPLPEGTDLTAFVDYYAESWQGKPGVTMSEAELCQNPARMVSFTENGQQKTFLMMIWRSKGFCVTMINPEGQREKSMREFQALLETFKVYQ